MLPKKVLTLIIVGTILSSLIFLIYTGILYYKVFTLSHKIQISIQSLGIKQENESFSVKITFLLENPSELSLKATYLQVEIYSDSHFTHLLGRSLKRSSFSIHGPYIALINAFSNGTILINIGISEIPENKQLFIKIAIRVEDVPIVNALYITRYFLWKL